MSKTRLAVLKEAFFVALFLVGLLLFINSSSSSAHTRRKPLTPAVALADTGGGGTPCSDRPAC